MNLRETILKEHSKANTMRIVNWIGNDQQRFNELFHLFLNDEYRIVQRASWPLSYTVIAHPPFIQKHWAKLLKNLEKPHIHEAVKRNTLRLIEEMEIPERYHGDIMNMCFDFIADPAEKAAVKASSLTILQGLAKIYPDIRQELKTIIEDRWEFEGAAFRSRAKRILKKMV